MGESLSSRPIGRGGGIAAWLGRILASLALASHRHPVATLLVVAGTWFVGMLGATKLELDPDITRLLPSSYQSVKDVESLRNRFGGVGYVAVLVRGGSLDSRRQFADALAPRLEALPSVRYVDYRRPVEFFKDRALYFLDLADLEIIRERLQARQTWQIGQELVGIDDEPPPPLDFADVKQKYDERLHLQGAGRADSGAYYEDVERAELVVLVRPTRLASDLTFCKQVVADVEGVVRAQLARGPSGDLRVELTGRYKKRVDLQRVLGRDLALTSLAAFALVLLYVAFHFRRVLATVLVLLPLYVGLSWSYGAAWLAFRNLNVLTAFAGAILVGIGIDHGIHMLGRYLEERREGHPPERAIQVAFGNAGRVSLAAAITSASAFACLAASDFRAFREFGALAATGMLLVLAAYLTVLPALIGAFERYVPRLSTVPASLGLPCVGRLMRWSPALFWVLATGALLALGNSGGARFNADFSALDHADLPSFRLDAEVNRLIGRSQTPVVLLADTPDEAREVAALLRARMRSLGSEATISRVAALADLVPENQTEKAVVVEKIRRILSRIDAARLGESERTRLTDARRMADARQFGFDELPSSVKKPFALANGDGMGHFVLAFPSVSMSDASTTERLAVQLSDLRLGSGRVLFGAGESMVLADILRVVKRDAPRILLLTLGLVFIALRMTLGRTRLALLSLAPAVVTLVVTAGFLPLFGIELNYLNMIMLPILLGIGVDDGAHFVARVEVGEPLDQVWRSTGWDVFGAILTDIFGFGVLAFAAHPGLASLGRLALVGLSVNLVTALVLLPAALATWPRLAGTQRGSGVWPTPAGSEDEPSTPASTP